VSKPSQVIVLVEDNRHQQFVLRYLRRCGLEQHTMRFVSYPDGAGSGEHWVRERFAVEVEACRRRRTTAETALIVLIDADNLPVQERLAQLDSKLDEAQADRVRPDAEQIARLVPKRNIETWILCLNAVLVDEATDYKRTRNDWTPLIRSGIETLYDWSRPHAQLPARSISSLRLGVAELKRLDFRGRYPPTRRSGPRNAIPT
jgi:hypothetical protein